MENQDDIPTCPDCLQGKHANCTGTTWNNTKDEETACPCKDESHKLRLDQDKLPRGFITPVNDKKHDEIVNTIASVMYQSIITREDLEDMLSQRISDLQWNRVHEFLHEKTKPQISKEDLFTNRPSMINVIREEIEQSWLKTIRRDKL